MTIILYNPGPGWVSPRTREGEIGVWLRAVPGFLHWFPPGFIHSTHTMSHCAKPHRCHPPSDNNRSLHVSVAELYAGMYFSWVLLEADTKTIMWGQIIYVGSDPGSIFQRMGLWGGEWKEAIKGAGLRSLLLWVPGARPVGKLWEIS